MRSTLAFLALLVASIPVRGDAQGARPMLGGRADRPPELRAKDIVRLSPARVPLERAREISLTSEQFQRLDSLGRAYELRAKTFSQALDTLDGAIDRSRRDLNRDRMNASAKRNRRRPENPKDSIKQARSDSADQHTMDEHLARGTSAQNEREAVLLTTREAFDGMLAAVNSILTEDQRTKLSPIFAGLSDEFTRRLHAENIR
jgi:hypothetical protein